MMHVYVYFYFNMNPCIYRRYLFVYILYINFCKSSVCICFNCMQFKTLCGIAQLDVGHVTICSAKRMTMLSHVACPNMGGWGCYNMVSELHFSTLSLDGLSKFELK
jgi:hypothetical protein